MKGNKSVKNENQVKFEVEYQNSLGYNKTGETGVKHKIKTE